MNGRETGAEYRARIEKYLSRNQTLPTAPNGSVNMTELARLPQGREDMMIESGRRGACLEVLSK
jgi:hypothetical protein